MANSSSEKTRTAEERVPVRPSSDSTTGPLPPQETNQPDPVLQLSIGRAGTGAVTLVALVCAVILGVVLYGLNSPTPNPQVASVPRPAPSAPAAGGKSGPAIPSAPETNNSGHG